MARRGAVAIAAVLALAAACTSPTPGGARVTRLQDEAAHARVGPKGSALRAGTARLIVPPGIAPANTVIGFGLGGVADAEGALAGSGVVVTASRALAGPLVVVLALDFTDHALTAGQTPGLLDVARGGLLPCLADGGRIACAVPAPGAYVVRGTTDDVEAPARPLLEAALAGRMDRRSSARPWWSMVTGLTAALIAGAAAALALRRGSNTDWPDGDGCGHQARERHKYRLRN